MILENNNCMIKINIDETFTIDSADNRYYDIIHGEIEIMMLNFDFSKKWSFGGKDIFVSRSNKKPFELHENSICLYDFEDNYYEIDYNGNMI